MGWMMEEVINSLIVIGVIVIVVLIVVGILKIRRNIRARKGTETEKKGKEFKKADSFSLLFKHYFLCLKSLKGLRNFCSFLFESLFGRLIKSFFRIKKDFIGKTSILLFLKERYLWLILSVECYEDLVEFFFRRKKNFIGKMSLFLKRRYIRLILSIKGFEELEFEEI